ncbi:MAG TPA: hydrogenase accessory protein HypB [Spirochaetaceae bacterium]|jgi:hydrogenase nickel incorporation protein HypB|nr:hydrogenase accessory protein HypB [Spirochaetaceae bacterium]
MSVTTRIIDVQAAVLADNDALASALKAELSARGIYLINLMGSPGAGKTSLLAALLPKLSPPFEPAVIEADLDSSVDADALAAEGWKAVQLRTGSFCHLDAFMARRGLVELGLLSNNAAAYDLVFIENIGNLICTAQVDTGAQLNVALLSVPEGDDKPLKYPVMFAMADIVVVTKADYLDRERFDMDALRARLGALRGNPRLYLCSARSGEGIAELAAALTELAGQALKKAP